MRPVDEKGNRTYFPKVKEAREYLLEKAKARIELQDQLIHEAAAAGEFEAALKANQWVIEHTPANEDGLRVIDPSASKPKEVGPGQSGPVVQIGIKFGGLGEQKQIEATLPIEAEVIKVE